MRHSRLYICLSLFAIGFTSCQREDATEGLFESVTNSGIDFENKVTNNENFNIFNYRNFYNGGGVGIGDVNNDGLPDVYMTSNMGENKLYLNKGNFKFEDITQKAGVADAGK